MNNTPFSFILLGQPATKKNSATMIKIKRKKKEMPSLVPSKAYKKYEISCKKQLIKSYAPDRLPHYTMPVQLTCKYYLQDKAHYPDLVGLMQATADILSDEQKTINGKKKTTCTWLLSDDRIIKSWDGTKIAGLDKYNPRVEITITPLITDITTETDPYIIKQLKEENNLFE